MTRAASKTRSRIEAVYPLSPLQEGLLFHGLETPETGAYVTQLTCRWRHLDEARLEAACQRVVDRTPVLRTAFSWRGETPLQVVGRRVTVRLEGKDWSGDWVDLEAGQRRRRWERFLADDRARGFDLARAPLLRLTAIRLFSDVHRFVWTHHHLLLDGWSCSLVLREVLEEYVGNPTVDPVPRRPYRDFIAWLADREEGGAEAFWRQRLGDLKAPTPLGVEAGSSRPAAEPREVRAELSPAESEVVRRFARRRGLTVSSLAHAAWGVLLGRLGSCRDVVFGTVVSGRPADLAGSDRMVGMFINTVPVRLEVDGSATVGDFARRAQEEIAAVAEHGHQPLVRLREWSSVPASAPLFDSLVAFENYPVDRSLGGGAEAVGVDDVETRERSSLPLNLSVAVGDTVRVKVEYDPQSVDPTAGEAIGRRFLDLMREMAADGDQRLDDLPLLGAEERRLLGAWGTGPKPPIGGASGMATTPDVVRTFTRWAVETPRAPAVSWRGRTVDYATLDRRVDRLARCLAARGIGIEDRVGVMASPTLAFTVALMAVLRSGAAFVVLDPDQPAGRREEMARDAGLAACVMERGAPAPGGVKERVHLDPEGELETPADGLEQLVLPPPPPPEAAAYLVYTSGSTGRPKGVVVSRGALGRYVEAAVQAYQLQTDDRVLQFAAVAFDVALEELFPTWAAGGQVVLRQSAEPLPPADLGEFLSLQGVTVANLPASYWGAWVSELEAGGQPLPADLRLVVVGSEPVPWEAWRAWPGLSPETPELCNAFGVSEATVTALLHRGGGEEERAGAGVSLGRPWAGAEARVVDRRLRLAPVAIAGELALGGGALARGYSGRPALTAERFVPDPFSGRAGSRLYLTGDRVRWSADGTLDFLGRLDFQVQLRGHRVEPGEVEAVLTAHPRVAESAVVGLGTGAAARLVAFVTGRNLAEPGDLEDHLANRLPVWMRPSRIVAVEELPRRPGGKVHRSALVEMAEGLALDADVRALHGELEELVALAWRDVLEVDEVAAGDDFFALGGHSLSALRLVSQLGRSCGVDLSLVDLFEDPTPAGLAARIAARVAGAADGPGWVGGSGPRPGERSGAKAPLSFAQERLWYLYRLDPGAASYNVPAGMSLRGRLSVHRLEQGLGEVLRRHEVLRSRFRMEEGEPLQEALPYRVPELPVVDLSRLPEAERAVLRRRLVAETVARPFDLEAGRIHRWRLLREADRQHTLTAAVHHVATDGWSMELLQREVGALQRAYAAGRPSTLDELPLQYADYAAWQRRQLDGTELRRQVEWWRQSLTDPPPPVTLTPDRPRPAVRSGSGAILSRRIPKQVATEVAELGRRRGATLYMTLLTGFLVFVSRLAERRDLLIGTTTANRPWPQVEPLIGFFVNLLPLRMKLDGSLGFDELLGRVRQVALGVLAHQHVPLNKLVERFWPRRGDDEAPFRINFGVERSAAGTGSGNQWPDVEAGPVDFAANTARFDLTLWIREADGELTCAWTYDRDLYDAATVEFFQRSFAHLLAAALNAPTEPIDRLEPLSDEDRRRQRDQRQNRESANLARLRRRRARRPSGDSLR